MRKIDSVLGVMTFQEQNLAPEAFRLLQARDDHRKKAEWAAADQIRKQLSEMGIAVHDTPEGMTWTLKQ